MEKRIHSGRVLMRWMKIVLQASPTSSLLIVGIILVRGLLPGALLLLWQNVYSSALTLDSRMDQFLLAICIVLAIYVFERFFSIGSYTIRELHEMKVMENITQKMHEKIDELPLEEFEKSETYDVLQRIRIVLSNNTLSQSLGGISRFLIDILSAIGIIGVLIGFHPWLAVFGILSMIPLLITRLLRGRDFINFFRSNTGNMRYLSYLRGLFTNFKSAREIKLYAFSDYLLDKWEQTRTVVENEQWSVVKRQMGSMLLCRIIIIVGFAAALFSAIYYASIQRIDLGMLAASIQAFMSLQETMIFIVLFGDDMMRGLDPIKDLLQFLNIETPAYTACDLETLDTIVLDDVSFTYSDDGHKALDSVNLTLHLRDNERIVAIVGENGAGKTTLAKVLLGIYRPTEGVVRYNGQDAYTYRKGVVQQRESAVFQDFVHYGFSLRENIALGDIRKKAEQQEMDAVVEFAGLQSAICNLPEGMDTLLGREFGGHELSGGEWQRVAIARAFFRDSEIIVFDEPTASLDPNMEYELLSRYMWGKDHRLKVLISHRIGSARLADRILVMKNGRIVEEGSHTELINYQGEYKRLYDTQAQWYMEE